jgi:hypothetical protein
MDKKHQGREPTAFINYKALGMQCTILHAPAIAKPKSTGAYSTPYFDPSFLYLSAFTLATTMGSLNPANTGAASSNCINKKAIIS